MNEEISRRLREAAEAHQPDRGRILARVERGTAGASVRTRTPGIARSWPKVALAGVAAAGILATAGLAVAGIVQSAPAQPDTATSATVTSPSGTSSSTRTTESPAPPAQGLPNPTGDNPPASGDPNPTSTADQQLTDGPLSSEGWIDPHSQVYWAQSNLTVTTTRPLTALTVELRITQTGGVATTGQWQTEPGDDFTVTVQEVDGALVYRWELKPGRTAPAGEHAFAAQYNHSAGPRDPHADRYGVQATADDGAHAVRGGFTGGK